MGDWIGAVSDEWNEQGAQQLVVIDEPRVELTGAQSLPLAPVFSQKEGEK